ncbi:MAG: hypothetical protein U0797_22555 [Gemmataceae bacterium]
MDWIVMKCLEKDRSRRCETASGLARDLERFLNDEPVLACPPSAGYRLRVRPAEQGGAWRSSAASSSACCWPSSSWRSACY